MENSHYLNDVEATLPRHFYNASTSFRETVYYVPKGNIIIFASNDNEYEGNTI